MFDAHNHYQMVINGELIATEKSLPVYNPATKAIIAQVPDCPKECLDTAVYSAKIAFKTWSKTSFDQRKAVLTKLADALEENAEDFMALLTREQGKPRSGTEWEVFGSVAWLRAIAEQKLEDEVVDENDERSVITRYTPLGVVGAIVPWNFPILLSVWKIAPALMAGCTVVVKPSPYTPLCNLKFAEMAKDIVPPGVLNCVSGGNEQGQWLTEHQDIAKIAFTGSTATGRKVMGACSETVKRVTLELGGNDPAIVLPDVDPKEVAPKLFWAAFQNNAQFCNATKRLYIHDAVYDQVRDALVDYINHEVIVGDGAKADTTLGPIQNSMQFEKVKMYFQDCIDQGQKFAVGGDIDDNADGWFVPVTLVDNPSDDSRIVTEEPFGPILPLLRWSNEEDVIARANDTIYGLGASIWGNDAAATQRIAEQIEAGTVWINEVHQYSPVQAFGGHKQSGLGCENSLHGLMEYTNWQTITRNKQA
ncbi:aldehyde dehydrogenase family protein [Alteromonas lipotrueae]|uniref:aldehyde dehydrogenase family protein n=1 Tax=Alteromonas lipotrueae TaxID=2803814 RepID=UPI001C444E3C|nr:aldehyde dehydrogenase family protein [Alteromonas lipotrueae]